MCNRGLELHEEGLWSGWESEDFMLWLELNPPLFAPESPLCRFFSGALTVAKSEAQPTIHAGCHAQAFVPVQIPVVCRLPGIH